MSDENTKEELMLNELLTVVSARATTEAWQEAKRRTYASLKELSYSRCPEQYGLRRGAVGELSEARNHGAMPQELTFTERARVRTEAALMVKHLLDLEATQTVTFAKSQLLFDLIGKPLQFLKLFANFTKIRSRKFSYWESLT